MNKDLSQQDMDQVDHCRDLLNTVKRRVNRRIAKGKLAILNIFTEKSSVILSFNDDRGVFKF